MSNPDIQARLFLGVKSTRLLRSCGLRKLSFAKKRSDRKPCSIRALANEMNRLRGGFKTAADNHLTQRYMPRACGLPGSREPLAIDVETWVLAPDAFLANHTIEIVVRSRKGSNLSGSCPIFAI